MQRGREMADVPAADSGVGTDTAQIGKEKIGKEKIGKETIRVVSVVRLD